MSVMTSAEKSIKAVTEERLAPFVGNCEVNDKPSDGLVRINWRCVHDVPFSFAFRYGLQHDTLTSVEQVADKMSSHPAEWVSGQKDDLYHQCGSCETPRP